MKSTIFFYYFIDNIKCFYCGSNLRYDECNNHEKLYVKYNIHLYSPKESYYYLNSIVYFLKNSKFVIKQYYGKYNDCYIIEQDDLKNIKLPDYWATDKNLDEIENKIKNYLLLS